MTEPNQTPGLQVTLRDYFAGLAMQGLMSRQEAPDCAHYAEIAYNMADSMKEGSLNGRPKFSPADTQTIVAQIDAYANTLADSKHYENLPPLAKAEVIRLAHALSELRQTLMRMIAP